MRVAFILSLPVRLAGWILLLSGATLLILTEVNRRAVERILIEQAEVQSTLATAAVTDGLDAVTGGAERLVQFLARDLAGRGATAADLERIARHALLDQPNLHGLIIAAEPGGLAPGAGRTGVYVHRSNTVSRFGVRDLAAPGQPFWEQDWYREVLDKDRPVWSEPYLDQGGSGRNVVRIAVPLRRDADDGREPVGAVAAVIELDWLRRLANVHEFSDTSFTIIFSRTGRLIIHPKATHVIAETVETLAAKDNVPALAEIRQNVIARRQGALSYAESTPRRQVHVNYRPAKVAGWGVIVGYDEAEFLRHQRAFRSLAAAYLGSVLLLLSGIVIGITRLALRPLGLLAGAAGEIARGNLDCAIPPPVRADEIGGLTRAFQAMRDGLKAQQLERRWAGQALEHQLRYNQLIIDSIGELVFVLTKVLNISRVNPAVIRATGSTDAGLVRAPLQRVVQLLAAEGGAPLPSLEPLTQALKDGRALHDLPARVLGKDGAALPARLTLVPLLDANRVVGGVVTLRLNSPAGSA